GDRVRRVDERTRLRERRAVLEPVAEHLVLDRRVGVGGQEDHVLDVVVLDEVQELVALRCVPLPAVVRQAPELLDRVLVRDELELRGRVQERGLQRLLLDRPQYRPARIVDRCQTAGRWVGGQAERHSERRRQRRREVTLARVHRDVGAATGALVRNDHVYVVAPVELPEQRAAGTRRIIDQARLAHWHVIEERPDSGGVPSGVHRLTVVVVDYLV